VQVEYTAPTFVAPDQVRFRYRVDGGPWTETDRRVAHFIVGPGRHSFEVRARNADGVPGDTSAVSVAAALTFALEPRLIQTLWLRGALALVALLALVGAHRLRVRAVEARHRSLLDERLRIARDVHDTLAQGFTGIALHLDAAGRRLGDPDRARKSLDEARALVGSSMGEVRRTIVELRLGAPGVDLPRALADVIRQLGGGAPIRLAVEGTRRSLPREHELALLRTGQEAIGNALRHAAPASIDVRLSFAEDATTLVVRDDGRGFDPDAAAPAGHFGLQGLRERAAALGGTLTIVSQRAGGEADTHATPGTTLTLRLPR
jgi:signal transduction histidine kinase